MIENRELFLKNIKHMLDDKNCGNVSDGDHSFSELYHHRAILTASLFNAHKEKCWKSMLHDTGDMFDVKELEKAPKWDGHTAKDAIERIRKEFC